MLKNDKLSDFKRKLLFKSKNHPDGCYPNIDNNIRWYLNCFHVVRLIKVCFFKRTLKRGSGSVAVHLRLVLKLTRRFRFALNCEISLHAYINAEYFTELAENSIRNLIWSCAEPLLTGPGCGAAALPAEAARLPRRP